VGVGGAVADVALMDLSDASCERPGVVCVALLNSAFHPVIDVRLLACGVVSLLEGRGGRPAALAFGDDVPASMSTVTSLLGDRDRLRGGNSSAVGCWGLYNGFEACLLEQGDGCFEMRAIMTMMKQKKYFFRELREELLTIICCFQKHFY
jgi:hypothetical protein